MTEDGPIRTLSLVGLDNRQWRLVVVDGGRDA